MSNTMTKSSVELLTQEKPVLNVNAPLPRLEEIEDDGLGNHPMWPEYIAALTAIRQADRERDEREYAE